MFFRIQDASLQEGYAGFDRCFVTHVNTRNLAPFGTAYPTEAHGQADVLLVCPGKVEPDEEWIEEWGGELRDLRKWIVYGYSDYLQKSKPEAFLTRIPQGKEEFANCPGFEHWTQEKVEATLKSEGISPFLLPQRFIFNQIEYRVSLDFDCALDSYLREHRFSVDFDNEGKTLFVSPRPPGPGTLEPISVSSGPPPLPPATLELWWVKPGRLAGMPAPDSAELPLLAATGVKSIVSLGTNCDGASFETAGIRFLALEKPDEWTPDPEQIEKFVRFCGESDGAIAVYSDDNLATGNMLGVALVSEGVPVEEAIAMVSSAQSSALESSGQMEFLFIAAEILGFNLE